MKKICYLSVILLISIQGFSQSLTGLWTGALSNDSNTVRRDQSFEMAITEYKGKVYGYSHSTFMVHDTLFFIVKRVKGTIKGNICEVKDVEIISCNFMDKIEKGIKQAYTFHLNNQDSVWRLDGNWKTNKTKKFYSISGSVTTSSEKDLSKSKLLPHLQELNLQDGIAAIQPPKEQKTNQNDIAKSEQGKKQPGFSKKETNNTLAAGDTTKQNPAESTSIAASRQKVKKEKTDEQKTVIKTEPEKQSEIAIAKPLSSMSAIEKPVAAANVEKRKSETIQFIEFNTDSISLALYDNGEIDGDTVSVLINGEVVLARQGLKATAIRKIIYITPAMQDSFTLTLYAENLGLYPPNTGLIIVRDGEKKHEIRFSADLQKNVAVVFRRKKKE